MSNYNCIYDVNYNKLFSLTGNHNKTRVLSKFLYWWQYSTYTLEDKDTIWFTRSLEQIAAEVHLSVKTISTYLKEFVNLGYIEKKCKLFLKKHLYIRITDRLLSTLNISTPEEPVKNPVNNPLKAEKIDDELNSNDANCSFSSKDYLFEKEKISFSIYKDKDNNQVNNIVIDAYAKKNNPTPDEPVNTVINDDIAIREDNATTTQQEAIHAIKTMMQGVSHQHQVVFSNPNQTCAEILFSLFNGVYWKATSLTHRLKCIAKLLIKKAWRTPFGFFKSAFGKPFQSIYEKSENPEKKDMNVTETPIEKTQQSTILPFVQEDKQADGVFFSDTLGELTLIERNYATKAPQSVTFANNLMKDLNQVIKVYHEAKLARMDVIINTLTHQDNDIKQSLNHYKITLKTAFESIVASPLDCTLIRAYLNTLKPLSYFLAPILKDDKIIIKHIYNEVERRALI